MVIVHDIDTAANAASTERRLVAAARAEFPHWLLNISNGGESASAAGPYVYICWAVGGPS